ncbi:AAA family ATPase [Virgibacillus ndiopensis]|uniref:AAA family ATPase n=1 Tax=Virgibacillus ndiopensis TaxID=2004408 RepID=UPI000C070D1C|nr:AAA family ATPase [Virgibacillus ndiopensis]
MRALSLSLRAFGPYWEKQEIDFTELGGESIFLITGPTGAGKTTIFDAICYALYGRASGSDRDQDSLRSHFATIDEPTEVQFRFTLNQKKYEVIRNPKQQKKKERGDGYTEEPAKAILYEVTDDTTTLISSRIKEVNETIEAKLGFDYEQFRKMVLIPQGEFRKLISENSKEREAILQKIFHTYFYEKITEELKLQSKELKEEIEHIEQTIQYEITKIQWTELEISNEDSIEIIKEKLVQEINRTKEKLAGCDKQKIQQQQVLNNAQNKLLAGKTLEEKFVEQMKLQKEQSELNETANRILQNKEKLKLAQKAIEIMPLENQSNARKKEWQDQLTKFTQQQEKVESLRKKYKSIEFTYNEAASKESERERLKEKVKLAKSQLDQVNNYLDLQKSAKQINSKKEQQQRQINSIEKEIIHIDNEMERMEDKLNKEQELTKTYYMKRQELDKGKDLIKQLENLYAENSKLQELRKSYKIYQQKHHEKLTKLEKLRAQYNTKDEEQKKQYAVLIAHHLEDGKPCPVCGSIEHPDKVVANEETIRESELEQLKKDLQLNEKEYLQFQEKFAECKSDGQSQRITVMKLYDQISNELTELDDKVILDTCNKWKDKVLALKQETVTLEQELTNLQELRMQRNGYKNKKEKIKQTFDQLLINFQKVSSETVKMETRLEELAKQLPKDIQDANDFKNQINEMEQTLNHQIASWENISQQYKRSYDELQKEKTILDQQKHFEENNRASFEKQYKLFSQAINVSGFQTIETYQEAKLSSEEQKIIESKVKAYDTRTEQIKFRLNELKKQIGNHSRPNVQELEQLVEEKQIELQNTSDTIHSLRLKINNDHLVENNIQEKLSKQKHLTENYFTIGELADLAHGNNQLKLSFERYVLASFLDEILIQANTRLDRLTEHRYQLIRSGQVAKRGAQSGLDLEVLDHHTGQQRSVKTLSGGEGFKAALSLALGLADVVQAHAGGVQMDTLFIDEGFGTLDEISLQQAIDCLKDLQESNRLLGIISHVPQLKNEIHAKLQIKPSHKGSRLAFTFGQENQYQRQLST